MPSCSVIDLAEIWRSSKISSWICSIISGVVTVLGRPGRGATQVEKITTFKLGHPVFDGGIRWCMFPWCFCQNGANFFRRLALQEKKNAWWQLASRCCWNLARRLTCFLSAPVTRKTCNSAHEQTPLSNDTIDSVLRHRELGRAKDLSAPRRNTYVTPTCLTPKGSSSGSILDTFKQHGSTKLVTSCKILEVFYILMIIPNNITRKYFFTSIIIWMMTHFVDPRC